MIEIHLANQMVAMQQFGLVNTTVVKVPTCTYNPEGIVIPRLDGRELFVPWSQVLCVLRPDPLLTAQTKVSENGSEAHGPAPTKKPRR